MPQPEVTHAGRMEMAEAGRAPVLADPVPAYLRLHYWWAYIHPNAVRLFERPWLVSLILWFNYRRLGDAALAALADRNENGAMPGRTLQIACVYGDLTERLSRRAALAGGDLDVVDVLPVQLENLARKLPAGARVRLIVRDSRDLAFPDACIDRVLLFFLLHEQPEDVRRGTLREAFRVVRPGGSVVVVDYARPGVWHPARYLWLPLLRVLEPFASDLWRTGLAAWLPEPWSGRDFERTSFCGGLYQVVRITR